MEKKNPVTEYLKEIAARGGTARAKRMTAKQRSASAKKAATARWGKRTEEAIQKA